MGRSYKALTVSNRGRMSAQLAILLMTSNPRLMYMHYNSSRKFTGRYGGMNMKLKYSMTNTVKLVTTFRRK